MDCYAAILKENGFPVGLTSKQPIEVIERRVKGFHHGYLHCRTYGIHFFVVHFWPKKDHEAKAIIEKIKPLLKQGENRACERGRKINKEIDTVDIWAFSGVAFGLGLSALLTTFKLIKDVAGLKEEISELKKNQN